MATKKKYNRLEEIKNFVSNEQEIKENIITPAIEDYIADKVRTFKNQGYNDNQIAAMLRIHKHVVEKIK